MIVHLSVLSDLIKTTMYRRISIMCGGEETRVFAVFSCNPADHLKIQ